jgi:hypothetical protein
MLLLILLIAVIVFAGLGFALHLLWIAALVALVILVARFFTRL